MLDPRSFSRSVNTPRGFGLNKFSLFGPKDYPEPAPLERPVDGVVRWVSVAGWDIGKVRDPSALCIIARATYGHWFEGPRDERWWLTCCRNLPRGMAYDEQAALVLSKPVDFLCFDATGGGGVIKDYIRRDAMRCGFRGRMIPITIASSNMHEAVHKEGGLWAVPKRELVAAVNICVQGRKIVPLPADPASGDPGTADQYAALIEQCSRFELTRTAAGSMKMEGKGHGVDDLVIAASLCAWWVQRTGVRREPAILC